MTPEPAICFNKYVPRALWRTESMGEGLRQANCLSPSGNTPWPIPYRTIITEVSSVLCWHSTCSVCSGFHSLARSSGWLKTQRTPHMFISKRNSGCYHVWPFNFTNWMPERLWLLLGFKAGGLRIRPQVSQPSRKCVLLEVFSYLMCGS